VQGFTDSGFVSQSPHEKRARTPYCQDVDELL
jgi:hypothetical protein